MIKTSRRNRIVVSQIVLMVPGIVLAIYGLWWTMARVDQVQLMSVRSKEWSREIKELEDYQSYQCHSGFEEKCTGFGADKVCRDEIVEKCGWETKTRTIKRCLAGGIYPDIPYWADCQIGAGHYERRYERYVIHFSDDKRLYNKTLRSEADYDRFLPRQKCLVSLNWFRWILNTNCNERNKNES